MTALLDDSTYSEERGQYESKSIREYHELLANDLFPEQNAKGIYGPTKYHQLVENGLLNPAGFDSAGRPYYEKSAVLSHHQFSKPDRGQGFCTCCGHCSDPDDQPSIGRMKTSKSMGGYATDDWTPETEDEQDRLEELQNQLKTSCDDLERVKRQVLDKAASQTSSDAHASRQPPPLSRNDLAILKSSISDLMSRGLSYAAATTLQETRLELVYQALRRLADADGNVDVGALSYQLGLPKGETQEMLDKLNERGQLRGLGLKALTDWITEEPSSRKSQGDDWIDDAEFNPEQERVEQLVHKLAESQDGLKKARLQFLVRRFVNDTKDINHYVRKATVNERVLEAIRQSPHNYLTLDKLGLATGLAPQELWRAVDELRRQWLISGSGPERKLTADQQRWLSPREQIWAVSIRE